MTRARNLTHFFKRKSLWIHGCSSPFGQKLTEVCMLLGARVFASDSDITAMGGLKSRYPQQLNTFKFDKSNVNMQSEYLGKLKSSSVKLDLFFDLKSENFSKNDNEVQDFVNAVKTRIVDHLNFYESLDNFTDEGFVYVSLHQKKSAAGVDLILERLKISMLATLETRKSFFDFRVNQTIETLQDDRAITTMLKALLSALSKGKNHLFYGLNGLDYLFLYVQTRIWKIGETLRMLNPIVLNREISVFVDNTKPIAMDQVKINSTVDYLNPPEIKPFTNPIPDKVFPKIKEKNPKLRSSINVFTSNNFPVPKKKKSIDFISTNDAFISYESFSNLSNTTLSSPKELKRSSKLKNMKGIFYEVFSGSLFFSNKSGLRRGKIRGEKSSNDPASK